MFTAWVAFSLCLTIPGTAGRTVSVSGRHHQHFAVRDIVKRSYIRLSDKHEAELGLDMYQPRDMPDDLPVNSKTRAAKEVRDWSIEDDADFDDDYDVDDDESDDELDDDLDQDDELEPDDADFEHELEDLGRIPKHEDVTVNNDDFDYFFRDIDDAAVGEKDGLNLGGRITKERPGERKRREINHEAETREKTHERKKRAAREQWQHAKNGPDKTRGFEDEDNVWEVRLYLQGVTDEELAAGRNQGMTETAEYIGITLLSVAGFAFVGICFIRDPVACIFAFGTGCPCCLICCPCVRAFTDKYLDTKRLVRESMNKYMPGVIVKEDGTMDFYEPTAEEIEILHEIIEEIQD